MSHRYLQQSPFKTKHPLTHYKSTLFLLFLLLLKGNITHLMAEVGNHGLLYVFSFVSLLLITGYQITMLCKPSFQNISGIFQLSLAPVPLPLPRPLSLWSAFLLPTRSTCLLSPPQIHSLHEARRIFLKHKLGCHSATLHLLLPLPVPSRESQTIKPTSSYGFQDPSPACLCVFPYSPSPSEFPWP